ncbi:MAG: sigma-70 family RNA polymerase sigma factor [Chitinispirillaceae bacterium]|nr:sigma-70 family RNA polymerase sigma factor [Chitinispirillaceae bacterium]
MDPDKAFAKGLYEEYGFLVYRTCLAILGSSDDAKDALQAVFMNLMEHYAAIGDKGKIVPWIFAAAKNHCFNVLRFRKKFKGSPDADDLPAGGNSMPDERLEAKELVRLAFLNYPRDVRDAVYFTYVEEYDQEEIRKMTGQSPATIRRNLKKFRDSLPHLRKRLEQ